MVCVTLSDQVTVHGAVPVSAAVIVVEPPGQIAPLPLRVAVGSGLTVTVADDDAVQPLPSRTVTVYMFDWLTVIDCVVAPVLHEYEYPAGADSVTLPPLQKVVGPEGVIVADGDATETVTDCDCA